MLLILVALSAGSFEDVSACWSQTYHKESGRGDLWHVLDQIVFEDLIDTQYWHQNSNTGKAKIWQQCAVVVFFLIKKKVWKIDIAPDDKAIQDTEDFETWHDTPLPDSYCSLKVMLIEKHFLLSGHTV